MKLYEKGKFPISNGKMEYITFGRGFPLLIIPGLGDGLTTVGKSALQLYFLYRAYGKNARIVIASRPEPVPGNSSTKTMAAEYAALMEHLDFSTYNVLGLSMGGMIGQFLASDFSDSVEKIVLAVTVPQLDEKGLEIIDNWIDLARNNEYKKLLIDSTKKTFQEPKASRYARLISIFGGFMKPSNLQRFIFQGKACLEHDSWECLEKIKVPSLVICAENDQITCPELGKEMAEKLPQSNLVILEGVGHGGFEEKKEEFNRMVWEFLSHKV